MTTSAPTLEAVSSALGNLNVNSSEINWVEAVDRESMSRENKRSEVMKGDLKIVTDFVEEEVDGVKKKRKVVTTYKVITKKVPRVVAERKKWAKFGQSKDDGSGPNINTTYRADEVEIQFLHNRLGEADDLLLEDKRGAGKGQATKGMHCRLCKSDDHWSTQCPYKEHFKEVDGEEEAGAMGGSGKEAPRGMGGTVQAGRYVPPSARGGGERTALMGTERATDDSTVRITNLPEDSDTLEEDLKQLFQGAAQQGKINRIYVARDKTTNKPKGFAFITFYTRAEAEEAIRRFNGAKFEHLILKVEWTRPSNN